MIDIDSLLRPTFGHGKQGASFGHTKPAGKQVLRRGLSPLVATISTQRGAPVIAGIRLRAGKANSSTGAPSMISEAIRTARAAGATGEISVRGDSAHGTSPVVTACVRAGARFSVVLLKTRPVLAAIAAIPDQACTPVTYPGAVIDPDTGELISDAEVAEATFTAFTSTATPVTARLVVGRVRDRARSDELFTVWRHHPFLTESTAQADITHRQHAIIETVLSDIIDGPLAHLPSGQFASNAAWAICTAITHNLLRAAGTLAGERHAVARGATLRRHLIAVPARLPARNGDPPYTYRGTGPGANRGHGSGPPQTTHPQQPDLSDRHHGPDQGTGMLGKPADHRCMPQHKIKFRPARSIATTGPRIVAKPERPPWIPRLSEHLRGGSQFSAGQASRRTRNHLLRRPVRAIERREPHASSPGSPLQMWSLPNAKNSQTEHRSLFSGT